MIVLYLKEEYSQVDWSSPQWIWVVFPVSHFRDGLRPCVAAVNNVEEHEKKSSTTKKKKTN